MMKVPRLPRPSAQEILKARLQSGLTQREAASLCQCSLRTWINWETGAGLMHPIYFDYFKRMTARPLQLPQRRPLLSGAVLS